MTTATGLATTTAPLQMIRAEISVNDFHRWMGGKRLADPDHAMHCLLTECFGELAPKPFRLITPRGQSTGFLYGYGIANAEALREAAAICADPLQCRVMRPDKLDSKPMPAQWTAGKRLGFEIRIRPVIRKAQGADRPKAEQDAFQVQAESFPKNEMPHSREKVYAQWLHDQFARTGGADLDLKQTKLVSFQRLRAFRKRHARYCEGPDALMRGILTITDPVAFAGLLKRGVGRHRAYGYGMLLLRPPGKTGGS